MGQKSSQYPLSHMVQWLGFQPFTLAARVRSPVWKHWFYSIIRVASIKISTLKLVKKHDRHYDSNVTDQRKCFAENSSHRAYDVRLIRNSGQANGIKVQSISIIPHGLVVGISAFHVGGPGSIVPVWQHWFYSIVRMASMKISTLVLVKKHDRPYDNNFTDQRKCFAENSSHRAYDVRLIRSSGQANGIEVQSISIIPHGLVVRIPAFHVGGPGSIPGVGTLV